MTPSIWIAIALACLFVYVLPGGYVWGMLVASGERTGPLKILFVLACWPLVWLSMIGYQRGKKDSDA